MANLIKVKGGTAAGLPALNDREPGWTTDTFKLYVGQGGVSKLVGEADFLKLSGGSLTDFLTLHADPTSALHAVTKQYADALAGGVDVKDSVDVATAAALPAVTAEGSGIGKTLTANAAGVLTVDGVATVLNDRILVKNQAAGADNGIYKVTTEGTTEVAFVLTRAIDADADAEVTAGMYAFVEEGTANADAGFVLTTNDPITVDTAALAFTQFTGAGQIVAGTGLTKTGNTLDVIGTANRIVANADSIDIDAAYVGQASIVTLGTITTGEWNATAIPVAKGGTGSAYFTVAGPTVARTYTFPDAAATILSDAMTVDGGTW